MKTSILFFAILIFRLQGFCQVYMYGGGGVSGAIYSSSILKDIFEHYNSDDNYDVIERLEGPIFLKGFNLELSFFEDWASTSTLEFYTDKMSGSRSDNVLGIITNDIRFMHLNFRYGLGLPVTDEEEFSLYSGLEFATGLQTIGQKKSIDNSFVEDYENIYFNGQYGLGAFSDGIFKMNDFLCLSVRPYVTVYFQPTDLFGISEPVLEWSYYDYEQPEFSVQVIYGVSVAFAYADY
ncbi:MAG: hypothetical protein H7Y00_03730 [Fimbriimonadaceae bacterium]|nr:hypothetical protein [Chitinophagales bacterium]